MRNKNLEFLVKQLNRIGNPQAKNKAKELKDIIEEERKKQLLIKLK